MTQSTANFVYLREAIRQYKQSIDELEKQLLQAEAQQHCWTKIWEQGFKPLLAPIIICVLMFWELLKRIALPIRSIFDHRRSGKAPNQRSQSKPTQSLKSPQRAIVETLRCRDAIERTLQHYAESSIEPTEEELILPNVESSIESTEEELIPPRQMQVPLETLEDLEVQDRRLKHYELLIARNLGSLELDQWRKLAKVDHQGWWWYIPHPLDQYDNLWGFLSIVLLTLSLVLAADLAPRFFKGGPNFWGALSAIVPAILTWLFSKDSVERAFQTKSIFENRLRQSNTNKLFQQEFIFVWSSLLFITMWLSHQKMGCIAETFYQQSKDIVDNVSITNTKRLGKAESNLAIALAFNPDHVEAHSLLGRLYTLRNDMQKAKEEYKIAAKSSLLAQGRLKRLEIFEKKQAKEPFYEINIPFQDPGQELNDNAQEKSQHFFSRLLNFISSSFHFFVSGIINFLSAFWNFIQSVFDKCKDEPKNTILQQREDKVVTESAFIWESLEQYETLQEEIKKIKNKLEVSAASTSEKPSLSLSEINDLEEDQKRLENQAKYFLNRAKKLLGYTEDSSISPPTLVKTQIQVEEEHEKVDKLYPKSALPRCLWSQIGSISNKSDSWRRKKWKRCFELACDSTVTEEKIWQYTAVKELIKIAPGKATEDLSCR